MPMNGWRPLRNRTRVFAEEVDVLGGKTKDNGRELWDSLDWHPAQGDGASRAL
jgi:hypothetical protein